MDAEDREIFRELAGQIDTVVGGVNGLVVGVNRLVDSVRGMGEILTSQMQTMREEIRDELRETRLSCARGSRRPRRRSEPCRPISVR